jgi:hypothetical protein
MSRRYRSARTALYHVLVSRTRDLLQTNAELHAMARGDSQISITLDTYSHVLPTMQIEAAGKMDRLHAS